MSSNRLALISNLTLGLCLSLSSSLGSAQLTNSVPRMAKQQVLNIFTGDQLQEVTLKANVDTEPALITTQKKSVQLLDAKKLSKENQQLLKNVLVANGSSSIDLDQYYIIDYFSHGFEKIKHTSDLNQELELYDRANYWVALLPKKIVAVKTLPQIEWFKEGIGGHGQVRYQLDQDLILVKRQLLEKNLTTNTSSASQKVQIKDLTKEKWINRILTRSTVVKIPGDLTFTLMAIRYEGGPTEWGAASGLTGVFANALTFTSTDHIALMQLPKNYVEQVELKNSASLGTQSLHFALNYASQTQETEIYHLIFNSCINAAFKVLSGNGQIYSSLNIYNFNPYTFLEQFKDLTTQNTQPSLNQEYNYGVQTRPMNKQVEPFINVTKSVEFERFVRQFSYLNLDLNYTEMMHLMNLSQELIVKAKSNQIELNEESVKKAIGEYLIRNNIQLTPELNRRFEKKSLQMLDLLKGNSHFLKILLLQMIRTQN